MKELYRKLNLTHLLPLAIYFVIYLLWFRIIQSIPRAHYTVLTIPADGLIPFVDVFIVPYISWFVYVPMYVFILYFTDREAYDRLATCLIIGMTAFLLISTLWPNCQVLRLEQMPRKNVFTFLVELIWSLDSPRNLFPSIHVFNTVAVWISARSSHSAFFARPRRRHVLTIWCVLICLSTMLVKQHSVTDVSGALVLMLILYVPVFRQGRYFRFRHFLSAQDRRQELLDALARGEAGEEI